MNGFHPDTQIDMADGSTKSIHALRSGDLVRGGEVLSTSRHVSQGFFWYDGLLVTGDQIVMEDGQQTSVAASQRGRQFKYLTEVICSIETTTHHLWAHGIEFLSANADITECQ